MAVSTLFPQDQNALDVKASNTWNKSALHISRLGLSTGRSGSGLCPTRNQPDHFGSPKPRPAADPPKVADWVVGCHRFPVGYQSVSNYVNHRRILQKSSPDFAKISGFCWIWPDLKEILTDLNEIRPDLNEIRPDLEEIRRDLNEIRPILSVSRRDRARSRRISTRSGQISTRSHWISTDRTKWGQLPTPIGGELKFRCVSRSGRLKIGFSCSNPSTDPPVSSFLGGDPLPTIADVGSDSFQAGSAGLGGLVGFRVWLDTPTQDHWEKQGTCCYLEQHWVWRWFRQ